MSAFEDPWRKGRVRVGGCLMRTRIGVPFIFVMRANLLAHELLVDDLLEFDHCGCGINDVLIRVG